MIATAQSDYAAEIRRYLVGRPSAKRSAGDIASTQERLESGRLLDWWLFEGKRYHGLEDSLAGSWRIIDRQARRLLASHSPFKRPVPTPEGEVDWLATAHQSFLSGVPEYICRTSRIGLDTDEAQALQGWRDWIAHRWRAYVEELGPPRGISAEAPWSMRNEWTPDIRQIRRWAFTARRSRWPLLRNVVAESLRAVLEEQEVDRLPLPEEHAVLFELVCIVRVLRTLHPEPRAIRWLDRRASRNSIQVGDVSCRYQLPLQRSQVLGTSVFAPETRAAIERQSLRVPKYVDGLFRFREPRNGFVGVLMECKSGAQGPAAAIYQLQAYREALRPRLPGPLLIIGVVENQWLEEWGDQQLGSPGPGRDHWVFLPSAKLGQIATLLAP